MLRILAISCFAAGAFEASSISEEAVSLLQTGVNKKKSVPAKMKTLASGPPWEEDENGEGFKAMVSEGEALMERTVLELDLHEKKPQGDLPDGMRFPKVGQQDGHEVDLLVSADKEYDSGMLNSKKGEFNGLYRGFARVYVKAGSSQKLKIRVVKAGTEDAVKVPLMAVSFFSLGHVSDAAKWATSVSDCNQELVSEHWEGPKVNEIEGGCGGTSFQGVQKLLAKGRSDPENATWVHDNHCPGSLVMKWFDASEINVELSAGKPSKKRAIPFIFKVGVTKCDAAWEAPLVLDKAEKRARLQLDKKAAKEAKGQIKTAEKAAAAAAKDAKKAAKVQAKSEKRSEKGAQQDENRAKKEAKKAARAEARQAEKAAQ